jgi:hypothetical protein
MLNYRTSTAVYVYGFAGKMNFKDEVNALTGLPETLIVSEYARSPK